MALRVRATLYKNCKFSYDFRLGRCSCSGYNLNVFRLISKSAACNASGESDVNKTRDTLDKQKSRLDLSFNCHRDAYKSKTNLELLRGLFVFKMCSYDYIVDKNIEITKFARRVFGKNLFSALMKCTVYGHFVAGENQDDIRPTIKRMRQFGVKAILDYSAEEDLTEEEAKKVEMEACKPQEDDDTYTPADMKKYTAHEEFGDRRQDVISARTYFYLNEAQCEKNTEIILNCIDAVSGATNSTGFAAVKLTALGRPQLLLQLSQIVVRMRQFFRLLTEDQEYNIFQAEVPKLKRQQFIEKIQKIGIDVPEDDLHQWFTDMDTEGKNEIDIFEWDRLLNLNVKMSQHFLLPDPKSGHLESIIAPMTDEENEQFHNMLRRMNMIAERAVQKDVRVMIDAEQSYFQPAINRLTIEMMRKFNKEKSVIFNTYQCYLCRAYDSIKMDLEFSKRMNFYFGAKLVRGAYMDQERQRAEFLTYEDPICATYEATNDSYCKVVDLCMQHIRERGGTNVAIMMATHNEDTVRMVVEKMQEYSIGPQDKVICFGQLLGMCDQVSYSLGQAGYSVYKYVPYGPVEKVLPYLSRRAQENRSLLKGAQKERHLMWEELKRRIKCGQWVWRLPPQTHNELPDFSQGHSHTPNLARK